MPQMRQWLLNDHPNGRPIEDHDFRLVEVPVPDIVPGEALAKTLWLGFDPAQKGWMENIANYVDPMAIGDVMRGSGIAQIVASQNPELPEGALVTGTIGWTEYTVLGELGGKRMIRLLDADTPYPVTQNLSTLGTTGLTAFFGLTRIGRPLPGDVVAVSGAAGATGSVVGQLARLMGCRAIGIAGGEQKCAYLRDLGYDAAIDYKGEDVRARLHELAPGGINVFYDNVGGTILNDALGEIAMGARIVICGGISRYEQGRQPAGPANYFNLIFQRARMEGFIVLDYAAEFAQARERLGQWLADGRLQVREDIQEGFENAPATLQRLFRGQNFGKQLLKVAEPA